MDPAVKAFTEMAHRRMGEQIDYLRRNNNNHRELEYFYHGFMNLHSGMIEELQKEKNKGKKIVGVYCNFVPIELILAAGAIPIRMCTGFSDTILAAEEVLPRNFCPLIKSSFGSMLEKSPLFDLIDVMVIPTSCDGKKKLCELIAEKKPVWIMEVPHTTNTPEARKLWFNEIKSLKKQLQKLTKRRITKGRIKKAVAITNNQRAQIHKLYNLRKGAPPIWGRDALLVTNFASFDDIERWTIHAERLNKELEKTPPIPAKGYRPRILVTGTPIVMPTWKMPILIEESGGIIVVDDICTGTKGFWDPVETSTWTGSDMLVSLADRYLMNTCATFTPNTARLIRLKRFVTDWNIDGVIYYVIMACHPYGMEQKKVNEEMEAMNIPVLNIETDFSEEDVEQIRTRLEAFIEMIQTRHALKTGTVLDKELHPRGHAMEGPAAPMTQEQVKQKLAEAPVSRDMDFPFEEVKVETPTDVNQKGSQGTEVSSDTSSEEKEVPKPQPTVGKEEAAETSALLNEVKQLVLKSDADSPKTKEAKAALKQAIDQYKAKDFTKAKQSAQEVRKIMGTE
jgi:benzoyl-CoA reductase/2-hydroxyglutaryl-CoA dehydratase subunit BcrC/BadD/HgdB